MIWAFLREGGKSLDSKSALEFKLQDLSDFVFKKLWRERRIVFHDTEADLEKDLELLAKLRIIDYDPRTRAVTIDPEKMRTLNRIAEGMRKDPMRGKVPIINEYLRRIEMEIPA